MNYETCPEIESVVAKYLNPRQNIIVPNVWWGLELSHECDLFVLTKTGYAYEVEIKISKSDLNADLKKKYQHRSNKIRKLYFAIPEKLQSNIDLIPERAGILVVNKKGTILKLREAKINEEANPLTDKERLHLAHLGAQRIWKLKSKLAIQNNLAQKVTL